MANLDQGENPVGTRETIVQLAEFVEKEISGWEKSDKIEVLLLRGLCRLAARFPDRASDGFTSYELRNAVQEFNKSRLQTDSKDEISKRVRAEWTNSEKLWNQKIEGLSQRAADQGLPAPKISRNTSVGGTGNPTRYRFEAASESQEITKSHPEPLKLEKGQIRYICEDVNDAGILARSFAASGFEVAGWRRYLLLSVVIGAIAIACLLGIAGALTLPYLKSLREMFIVATAIGLIVYYLYRTVGPIFKVFDDRILIAPFWMQSVDDDRLLELRKPPRFPNKSLKLVRYRAKCCVEGCGGHVTAKSGGKPYQQMLIGRCEESPNQHVYTFDHITRIGVNMNEGMVLTK